ncbi:MAG: F0F1 ATP synthase subunit A [Polyangiaceae bacterium]
MPEHTSFFTYFLAWLSELIPAFRDLPKLFGHTMFGKPVSMHTLEPLFVSLLVMGLLVGLSLAVKGKITVSDEAVIPDDKLSLRTIFELLVGFVYDTMKDAMGADRAKKYFPVVATAFLFVLSSNMLGLIPGFAPPTSSWDVTLGAALVIFIAFNYYGFKENGLDYIKHLAGPVWWLAWLILPLEIVSTLIRPLTLSVRLMINMSVDHLMVGVVHSLFMYVLPVAIMMLGTLVIFVQAYVFTLLSAVYIALATEHEEHGDAHAKHDHDHDHEAHDHDHAHEEAA